MITSILRYIHRFACCIDPNEYDPNEPHRWNGENAQQQYVYAPMKGGDHITGYTPPTPSYQPPDCVQKTHDKPKPQEKTFGIEGTTTKCDITTPFDINDRQGGESEESFDTAPTSPHIGSQNTK